MFLLNLMQKYKTDSPKLNAVEQEIGEGLKEPTLIVYKDGDSNSLVNSDAGSHTSLLEPNGTDYDVKAEIQQIQQKNVSPPSEEKNQGQLHQKTDKREAIAKPQPRRVTDEKVKGMKDQLIRAKAYLNFAPPASNSHLVKELKLRIKEVERAVGDATKDSDLSRSAVQRMRSMEASLLKASRVYTDCSAMATKLRAMTYNTEEQVRAQKNQAMYLVELASRTTPKGLHCLSMRLTDNYFMLQPEERELPNQHKLNEPNLYHYVVFSDNILACAVVVNSTIFSASEQEKIVFHVVTDAINLPAIKMWFLLNPPGQATIQIKSIEDFEWLSSKYGSMLKIQDSRDPRYSSSLNHLRFYLPEVFPALNKIVLLDHDVVVQRDLRGLWRVDMKGKVNGAVETCREGDSSFRRMDMLINFSDPTVAKRFDANACTWAFGMNVFDLREWRRRDLTAVYTKYLELGKKRELWKGGTLPLGLVTFYNQTVPLDHRWHILGLGYESGLGRGEIERAAVIHYDGNMKPWLEIGIGKYKGYWNRYVKYDHPFLQQCNIHE
ncbi:Glycosyl transferase [Macleaya cordata]|uniref:Hexosyltransferase n=1 Tax=Macleaya cordata TaxID=56857 RepID=A0A200Q4E6_MACCD|nr:Glycosyl transferase [Macleaya cordata]